jgi:hypothetical protein
MEYDMVIQQDMSWHGSCNIPDCIALLVHLHFVVFYIAFHAAPLLTQTTGASNKLGNSTQAPAQPCCPPTSRCDARLPCLHLCPPTWLLPCICMYNPCQQALEWTLEGTHLLSSCSQQHPGTTPLTTHPPSLLLLSAGSLPCPGTCHSTRWRSCCARTAWYRTGPGWALHPPLGS